MGVELGYLRRRDLWHPDRLVNRKGMLFLHLLSKTSFSVSFARPMPFLVTAMPDQPATSIRSLFWGWDAPVLERAVAHLTQDWDPASGALDLEQTLIVVPTSEAGRRLKEALARATDQHGRGASVTWVWTPEQALSPPQAHPAAATRMQAQMAWQQALQKVPLEALTALFPKLPEERGWLWQVEMAELLADLKSTLGAGGLSFAEAEAQVSRDAARWRELAMIERAYFKELETAGLHDSQALKRRVAGEPILPEGVREVLVLPAPDLPPLLTRWVQACAAQSLHVTVAVHAPQALQGRFDAIGRPLPAWWGEDADVVVPLGAECIHLCHDAAAQAGKALDLIRAAAPLGRVAVGIGDPEPGSVMIEKLRLEEVRVFEPSGIDAARVGLWHVLQQMQTLMAGGSWRAFATLLRVPEVRAAFAPDAGLEILEAADTLTSEHMPVTLSHARELLPAAQEACHSKHPRAALDHLAGAIREMEALIREMQKQPLVEAARSWLLRLYGSREFDPNHPQDHLTTSLGDAWLGFCEQIQEETQRFGLKATTGDLLALSLQALHDKSLTEARGEIDLVLQGWLELLWEPSPNLVVAGVNEEHVPGILIAHPFLPDRVRESLGLPCQATRFARDAYSLRALAEQRLLKGSLHLLCGQWSDRGDALRPSRLLLLCDDRELPDRVGHLFPKDESSAGHSAEPVRSIAWKLRPTLVVPAVETISPSRLRSYLTCPFRDYFSQELRMEAVDPSKRELAPTEFGTLAHHAFYRLALDDAMKRSTDPRDIADFLIEAARSEMHRLYGRRPAPLISIQFETLLQNLRYAAETEAAQRQDGWQIYQAEWVFGAADDEHPLLIEGARLRCKIDRVDRHEKSGHLRVLDFKTSDKARSPIEAHAEKIGPRRKLAETDLWKTFQHTDSQTYLWRDLQLPLYAAALRLRGLRADAAGYFALPKSVQETGVQWWEDFGDAWIDRALDCAAEIVRRQRAGNFWPPAAKAWTQDYEELFLGDIEQTVEF